MEDGHTPKDKLLEHPTNLCRALSKGQYSDAEVLFDLTRKEAYPGKIADLAESFGMMLVQVEAREFHLKQLVEQLQQTQAELKQARDDLARENVGLKRALKKYVSPKAIIGQHPKMRKVLDQAERVTDTSVSVMITGETGTGKELIARSLHYNSSRCDRPFVDLNCSTILESLVESELFGIEKGVASGVEKRIGRIEQASGGTLFLDEIGDLPLPSQAKLLRGLQERKVVRVGGKKDIPVDIRLVTATHKDLQKEFDEGRFRQDLYYRIKVVNLHLPPLRDRASDIPLMLNFFLERHAARLGREQVRFSQEAMRCLEGFGWPGNVRELENEVERDIALASGSVIEKSELSSHILSAQSVASASGGLGGDVTTFEELEKNMIVRALSDTNDNKTQAAKRLGISREGLRKKMKRLGLVGSG